MSLPQFPNSGKLPTLEQALSAIVASIAMEEVALSRVITAESEKIELVVDCAKTKGCGCANIQDILAVNTSVMQTMKAITELQKILKEKLAIASKHLPILPCPPRPPHPPCPPHPPLPPCTSVFVTETDYTWRRGRSLFLMGKEKCNNGVKVIRRNSQSLIILPRGKEIEMRFELEARNNKPCPVVIDMELYRNGEIVKRDIISTKNKEHLVKIMYEVCYKTSKDDAENAVAFKLVAPEGLNCVNAKVLAKVKRSCS